MTAFLLDGIVLCFLVSGCKITAFCEFYFRGFFVLCSFLFAKILFEFDAIIAQTEENMKMPGIHAKQRIASIGEKGMYLFEPELMEERGLWWITYDINDLTEVIERYDIRSQCIKDYQINVYYGFRLMGWGPRILEISPNVVEMGSGIYGRSRRLENTIIFTLPTSLSLTHLHRLVAFRIHAMETPTGPTVR